MKKFILILGFFSANLALAGGSKLYDPSLDYSSEVRWGSATSSSILYNNRFVTVKNLYGSHFSSPMYPGGVYSSAFIYWDTYGATNRTASVKFRIPTNSFNNFQHTAIFALAQKSGEFYRYGVAVFPTEVCIEMIDPIQPFLANCVSYGSGRSLQANTVYTMSTSTVLANGQVTITGDVSGGNVAMSTSIRVPRPSWYTTGLNTFLGKMSFDLDKPFQYFDLYYENK